MLAAAEWVRAAESGSRTYGAGFQPSFVYGYNPWGFAPGLHAITRTKG